MPSSFYSGQADSTTITDFSLFSEWNFFDGIPACCHWPTQTCDDLRAFFRGDARGNAALLQSPPGWGKMSAVDRAARAEGALYAHVIGQLNGQIAQLIHDSFNPVEALLKASTARATVAEVRAALRGSVETCVAALAAGLQLSVDAGVSIEPPPVISFKEGLSPDLFIYAVFVGIRSC